MSCIPWPRMVFKVERIESFVRPFSDDSFSVSEMNMKHVPVKKVFHKGPANNASNKEKSRDEWMV
jgi:hypothetical protein